MIRDWAHRHNCQTHPPSPTLASTQKVNMYHFSVLTAIHTKMCHRNRTTPALPTTPPKTTKINVSVALAAPQIMTRYWQRAARISHARQQSHTHYDFWLVRVALVAQQIDMLRAARCAYIASGITISYTSRSPNCARCAGRTANRDVLRAARCTYIAQPAVPSTPLKHLKPTCNKLRSFRKHKRERSKRNVSHVTWSPAVPNTPLKHLQPTWLSCKELSVNATSATRHTSHGRLLCPPHHSNISSKPAINGYPSGNTSANAANVTCHTSQGRLLCPPHHSNISSKPAINGYPHRPHTRPHALAATQKSETQISHMPHTPPPTVWQPHKSLELKFHTGLTHGPTLWQPHNSREPKSHTGLTHRPTVWQPHKSREPKFHTGLTHRPTAWQPQSGDPHTQVRFSNNSIKLSPNSCPASKTNTNATNYHKSPGRLLCPPLAATSQHCNALKSYAPKALPLKRCPKTAARKNCPESLLELESACACP